MVLKPHPDPGNIITELSKKKYSLQNEAKLQSQIESVLSTYFPYTREHRLSKADRIDFLVAGSIGIEIKINRAENSLLRQAARYLLHPEIESLILVTIRPVTLPDLLLKKPLYTLALWDKLNVF